MWKWISSLFAPANEVLKTIDISGNERKKIENALAQVEAELTSKFVELEKARFEMHAKLVAAEAASPHKINATWRPIASLTLVCIACLAAFDIIHPNDKFYDLLQLVLGGHIITSSASNGLQGITKVLSKK